MDKTKKKNPKTTKTQAAMMAAIGLELVRQTPDAVTRAVHGDEVADLVQLALRRGDGKNSSPDESKKPRLVLGNDR